MAKRYLDRDADLDLRKLRYFLAVAHHLNFSRAAQELVLAQPALSRAIKALENDLGARLFDRDHHSVSLTAAGAALVTEAEGLLARAVAARRRVTAARTPSLTLTIGVRPGIVTTEVVRRFTAARPDVAVVAHRIEWDEQHAAVLDGRVDVAWIRRPVDDAGLRVVPLHDDPELLAVPVGHPLASASVMLADLADEPMLRYDTAPVQHTGRDVSGVRTLEETLEAVAQGKGLALVPSSAAADHQRPDITYRPVADAPPYGVALAVAAGGEHRPEVESFLRTAIAVHRG
jgi:DNA-binding transcriptional LysR family regulator